MREVVLGRARISSCIYIYYKLDLVMNSVNNSDVLFVLNLTSSTSKVRQGACFFVSLILMDFAFWEDFRERNKLSGVKSK